MFLFACSGVFFKRPSLLVLSCTYPAPESAVSPKTTDSFSWEMVLRDQDLGARCAHNCWVSLVLGPFNRQRKYVHLHTQMVFYI